MNWYTNITVYLLEPIWTPNPRPRPVKGPDTTVYKKEIEEKVERKIVEEPENVDHLARNSKHTLSPDIIEQIETITPTFRDIKSRWRYNMFV